MPRTGITMPRTVAGIRRFIASYANSVVLPGATSTSNIALGPDAYNYERTQPFSIAFWIFPLSYPSWLSGGHIFSDYLSSGTFRGRLIRSDTSGQLRFWLINNFGTNELKVTYQSPNLGEWTRVVFTYSGSSSAAGVKCYFNTTLQTQISAVETLSATIAASGINTRWGNWGGATALGMPMHLAKPAVLNYELTSGQVQDDYFSGVWSGGNPVDEWLFTEGSGTAAASTGSHPGTLGATASWTSTNVPIKARTDITQARLSVS